MVVVAGTVVVVVSGTVVVVTGTVVVVVVVVVVPEGRVVLVAAAVVVGFGGGEVVGAVEWALVGGDVGPGPEVAVGPGSGPEVRVGAGLRGVLGRWVVDESSAVPSTSVVEGAADTGVAPPPSDDDGIDTLFTVVAVVTVPAAVRVAITVGRCSGRPIAITMPAQPRALSAPAARRSVRAGWRRFRFTPLTIGTDFNQVEPDAPDLDSLRGSPLGHALVGSFRGLRSGTASFRQKVVSRLRCFAT